MSLFMKGLFGGTPSSGGGGGSGTGWDGRVNTFADLPSAAANANKYYMVDQATGTVGIDYKSSGIYRSDGVSWTLRGTPPLTSVLIGGILVSAAALGVFGSSTIKVTPDSINGTMTIEGNYTAGNGLNITGNVVSVTTGGINLATDSGNVGVGTTAPSAKLQINGTMSAASAKLGTSSTVGQVWTASDTVGNGGWVNATGGAGGSSQWTNTTGGIYYSSGNVAIGTTDTTVALNVVGTVNATTVTATNLPIVYVATQTYGSNSTTNGTDMYDLSFDVVAGKKYLVEARIGASSPSSSGGFGCNFHANTTTSAVSNNSFGEWSWNYDVGGGGRTYIYSFVPANVYVNGSVPSAQPFTSTGRYLAQTFRGVMEAVQNATIYPTFKTASTSYTTTTSNCSMISVTQLN